MAGHVLPEALVAAVRSGRWVALCGSSSVASVFGEMPGQATLFYGFDEMKGETSRWVDEDNPAYLGQPPEDLDPRRSVLIGDLGHDRAFALDYRVEPPSVRLLALDGRWVPVADSIDDLIGRLGGEIS